MTTPTAADLRIAGLTRLSTVDWPDALAATVFLQGCPWDCFYCHNPALIAPRAAPAMTWDEVAAFLDSRIGLLEAVVFTGGEPTMQPALLPAMAEVRARGFAVGLHTGGAYPRQLARVLPLVDWVGLDIKAATDDDYTAVTGRPGAGERAWQSLELVLAQQRVRADTDRPLQYEVRTTVHPGAIDESGLTALGCRLADAGVRDWAVQRFRDTGTRAPLPRGAGAYRAVALDGIPTARFDRVTVR
ncbi:anaerobic ribonucleoside-triphosphate reductase activating protein [Microbacterium sp. zg.Y625]|uniref:anaerobic ribonucleoside-triphosphate reductase activating protein n=1 Tax=Microbacterium jiangjiandongii TaxID=3049071 RepID=UPI00214C88E4|nr:MULTISPECIES: anaerobic ribonucleoside-triphosphate reductase activating protein [unclassified Microbacterium]MCR2792363.1 anaerobic ribonucleoside-triphosphate reductase activating protein [Microbacterium sp. zg.Y625]WIM26362.1 anaerobic ribonucleoside-triphosphate reductase activating protein [Microbacterium sp. zg-Y625]